MASAKGPYRLVTVNTAPDRARRKVGQAVEALRDHYTVEHVANSERIEQVTLAVSETQPNICVSLSHATISIAAAPSLPGLPG